MDSKAWASILHDATCVAMRIAWTVDGMLPTYARFDPSPLEDEWEPLAYPISFNG
nr:MAG: hypothetical protein H4BulkLitter2315159_000002 [Mitovirus sp.]